MTKEEFFLSRDTRVTAPHGLDEVVRIQGKQPLLLLGNSSLKVSESDKEVAVLVGECYDESGQRLSVKDFLNNDSESDSTLNDYLDGSYILLLIDKETGDFKIKTDPVNSRKVFIGFKQQKNRFYTTSLHLRPEGIYHIDFAALGSYLANGVIYSGRTIFSDIQLLDGATLLDDTGEQPRQVKYWEYKISGRLLNESDGELLASMKEHLLRSVRIRARERLNILISISGGYDSAGIAGIMQFLGHSKVSTFSYIYGEAKVNSDAFVAKEMAAKAGYKHQVVQSYQGDLLATIKANGASGEGMANFCDEIDIWKELNESLLTLEEPVLFAGDMYYLPNVEPSSEEDCLTAIGMNAASILAPYKEFSDKNVFRKMVEGWDSDYHAVATNLPEYDNLKDLKDELYLNYRIPHTLMVWREMIQMRHVSVVNPFLDRKLLGFVSGLSTSHRDGKSLYIKALKELSPHLFKSKRAKNNRVKPNWKKEIIRHQGELINWLTATDSRLDALFSKEDLTRLIEVTAKNKWSFLDVLGRAGRSLKYRYPAINRMFSGLIQLPDKRLDTAMMTKRLLVLRSFLIDE